MRYLITFSYDGSKYNGYQKQPTGSTIQGKLEDVLELISGTKVGVVASGRTDALVHALNQKAHFDLDMDISCEKLIKAFNGLLPKDIYVKDCVVVNSSFHARYSVKSKEYMYVINTGEYNPIMKDYVFQYNRRLDLGVMREALKYFCGVHDFRSFTAGSDVRDNYEREIFKADIEVYGDIVIISFLGTGFMRYMVRNMVGTLIDISEGKFLPSDLSIMFGACDRKSAGRCAPACGLYLKDVLYI